MHVYRVGSGRARPYFVLAGTCRRSQVPGYARSGGYRSVRWMGPRAMVAVMCGQNLGGWVVGVVEG